MSYPQLTIAPQFHGSARVGVLEITGVRVQETPEGLKNELNHLAEQFSQAYKDKALGEIENVRKIRAILHRSGLDPTRYRASSESLLRRSVKGKGLYFINSVVDLINYYSLKTLCPMGLYDMDRLAYPLTWRPGNPGESYEGIGRDRLNLQNFPLLVDREGPFGSPISDSMRTRVTESCTRILWITFAPPGAEIALAEFAAGMAQWNGGEVLVSTQYEA